MHLLEQVGGSCKGSLSLGRPELNRIALSTDMVVATRQARVVNIRLIQHMRAGIVRSLGYCIKAGGPVEKTFDCVKTTNMLPNKDLMLIFKWYHQSRLSC